MQLYARREYNPDKAGQEIHLTRFAQTMQRLLGARWVQTRSVLTHQPHVVGAARALPFTQLEASRAPGSKAES